MGDASAAEAVQSQGGSLQWVPQGLCYRQSQYCIQKFCPGRVNLGYGKKKRGGGGGGENAPPPP